MISSHPTCPSPPHHDEPADTGELSLDSFSYHPRAALSAALERELARSGCWLLGRRIASATATELRFELQLADAMELYGGLLAAGLELTRGAHAGMAGLCTLHQHRGRSPGCVITVRLTVNFLDEVTLVSLLSAGAAHA